MEYIGNKVKKLFSVFITVFLLSALFQAFPCILKVLYYPVYREHIKQSFMEECKSYSVLESGNIRVYYKGNGYVSANIILENAVKDLDRLLDDLDYEPSGDINCIIYPEYEKMAYMMELGTGSPALGAYYCGTVGIYDPDGLSLYKPGRESLVLHELTHYMLDYMTGGNIPPWFTEGMALYQEYKVYGSEWAEDRNYTDYYSIEELQKDFYGLDEIKAYKQSYLIVKYIGDNFGNSCINDIIKGLGAGKSMDQALLDSLGMDGSRIIDKIV